MNWSTVRVETKDQITTITLNRPGAKNAMNPKMHFEMCEVMAEIERDDDSRVVVLTGAGDSFCAGMDLKEFFLETEGKPAARREARKAAFEWIYKRLRVLPKPTIAKVNGWCFGGGIVLLGVCDFAVGNEAAMFGLSEVNWGVIPAGGATKLASLLLAPRDALHMVMIGKPFDGRRAAEMRLINSAVPLAKLDEATIELAEDLKRKHPAVLAACKETFRIGMNLDVEDAVIWERAMWSDLDAAGAKTWMKGVKQFEEKSYRPGLESYDWKK